MIYLKLFLLIVLIISIESCSDDAVILPPDNNPDTNSVFTGNWICKSANETDTLDYSVSINYYKGTFYGSANLDLISLFKFTEDSSQVYEFLQTGKISISATDSTINYYFSADSSFIFNGKYNPVDTTISGKLESEDYEGNPRKLNIVLKKKSD